MKIAEKPTPYVYIRAYTPSEWDSCDFAIIKISRQWLEVLNERMELLDPFLNRSDFYSHEYWDAPYGYFVENNQEEEDLAEILTKSGGDWCFIETDPEQLKRLKKPEAALSTHQLVITSDGYAHFTALAKHSDESYYTAEFNINELLKDYEAININS